MFDSCESAFIFLMSNDCVIGPKIKTFVACCIIEIWKLNRCLWGFCASMESNYCKTNRAFCPCIFQSKYM